MAKCFSRLHLLLLWVGRTGISNPRLHNVANQKTANKHFDNELIMSNLVNKIIKTMIEVTKEKFQESVNRIPYKTSFLLGNPAIRYEGSGRKFKNSLFAKQENGKYYLIDSLILDK